MNSNNTSKAVDLLNDALKLDKEAVNELFHYRVDCNDALAYHPNIQVRLIPETGKCKVGAIGIINGIMEILDSQKIGMIIEDGEIKGFVGYEEN